MPAQIPIDSNERNGAVIDDQFDSLTEVTADVAYKRLILVNVVFYGRPGSRDWCLIDAGIHGSARAIINEAESRFDSRPPRCIILTHGHFDHIGAIERLLAYWDVPVYAHRLEHPHLDGSREYPEPDPEVGGGMMSAISRFYPRGPIDITGWLKELPPDGSVPGMPGWAAIHTPGHTKGHISLWREMDGVLISGDAVITTRQESAYAVATQRTEIHGPPMYYTPDWEEARESVRILADLKPEICISGHGPAIRGTVLRNALSELARNFDNIAVPHQGRYVIEH